MAEDDGALEDRLVAVVDDHQLLTNSLAVALRADGFSVLVPELTTVEEVRATLTAGRPAVALVDLDLGEFGNGRDLVPFLVQLGTRVVIVSGHPDEAQIGQCVLLGASGWVPKSAPFEQLLGVVDRAAKGEPLLSEAERDRLLRAWGERRAAAEGALAPFERLSRREADVLGRMREGKSVERIAAELYLSENTVRTHVQAILRKLEVRSQLEAVAKATDAGWQPES